MKILLTAPPGLGKSTVIESVVRQFPKNKHGIVAREILNAEGKRVGFTSVNNAGHSCQFMFLAKTPGTGSIGGEFDVDIDAIDGFVVPELRKALEDPHGLTYVDEIGRAQAKSEAFLALLRQLFQQDCNILGAIVYEPEPWSLEFKQDQSVCVVELNKENRAALPDILLAAFNCNSFATKLSIAQQQLVYELLRMLISSGQFASAKKLFDNAIPYAIEKRVQAKQHTGDQIEYEVIGKERRHKIVHSVGKNTFSCDCDLSNGKGMFAGRPERCSHELSILLTLPSAQVNPPKAVAG